MEGLGDESVEVDIADGVCVKGGNRKEDGEGCDEEEYEGNAEEVDPEAFPEDLAGVFVLEDLQGFIHFVNFPPESPTVDSLKRTDGDRLLPDRSLLPTPPLRGPSPSERA